MAIDAPRKPILVKWDYDGWEAIAEALGVDVSTAKRWADLPDDPLPVSRMQERGWVKARAAQLQAWIDRRFAGGKQPA